MLAALKQAEVGIAVSNATDVAKGSASVVLTEEGLSNVVNLVVTGRMIYQRILTWIFNKIVKTFQVVLFVIVAFLLPACSLLALSKWFYCFSWWTLSPFLFQQIMCDHRRNLKHGILRLLLRALQY